MKKWCYSKLIVAVLIAIYVEQVVYGQVAMWHFGNLDSLPDMWANIVPPIIGLLGYFIKSAVENRRGGIVYDSTMKESGEHEDKIEQ